MFNFTGQNKIIIITPVFNDWDSAHTMLENLDESIANLDYEFEVLMIDDGSQEPIPQTTTKYKNIKAVRILKLKRNLGHQRAIAVGLSYVVSNYKCMAMIVMDSDGEDSPKTISSLIDLCEKTNFEKIVFVSREKRSEGFVFRLFYYLYKIFYRILIGTRFEIGNFSIIPSTRAEQVVIVSEIWNHFASGIKKAKIPTLEIPAPRGIRYTGKSKMNFISLINHGIASISVYGETAGARLLLLTLTLALLNFMAILVVVYIKIYTPLAIPGWASNMFSLLSIILLQAIMFAASIIFLISNNRNTTSFIPLKEHALFVQQCIDIKIQ